MASPIVKSYENILGDLISTYISKVKVNDLNTGSAVLSFFEAISQQIYLANASNFSILRDFNIDRATGEVLKKIAKEENVKTEEARVTTGKVTVRDSSFDKISTKIYAGANPPNVGSTVIKVSDASDFSSSGNLYIGRGTPNVEGPLPFSGIVQTGGFWEITLTSPTAKFHNLSESVILAQGGVRTISVGSVVRSPASGNEADINFTVTQSATILDGENQITNVPVAAQQPGSDGNVSKGAIKEFVSNPFSGSTVTNDSPFVSGKDADTDDDIRNKIKRSRISKGLGTVLAIKNATLGARANDENSIVTSNEIFSDDTETILYVDDGTGYEEKTNGIGLEPIVDSALGGETHFQLATAGTQTSIAKAFLDSSLSSPFDISPNDKLAILVGGILSEHTFNDGDFRSNGFATAYEVVSSINSNSDLDFSARTIGSGTKVVVEAKAEDNEYLQITTPTSGNDAATALGLTSNEVQTLLLYKNKQILSKNGRFSRVESEDRADWSNTIATGDTLKIAVDGTSQITYTFLDADFIAEGTYTTVSKNNSLASWISVINTKIVGVTATINGNRLVLTSNLGTNSRAMIEVDNTSTLVTKGMFGSDIGLSSTGAGADYNLSRNTAQIKLLNPLEPGDVLSAGNEFTKGFVESGRILGGSVTLSTDALMWLLIDNKDAEIINTGIVANTFITVTKPSANIVRYTSSDTSALTNVEVGDYVIVWSEELSSGNRLEGRINAVTASSFDLKVTPSEYASAVAESLILFIEGMKFIRTDRTPQKLRIIAGAYNINTISDQIETDIYGVTSSTKDDEIILVTTKSNDLDGFVLVVTLNDSAKSLSFTEGQFGESTDSQIAFYESQNKYNDFPLFLHSSISDNQFADPLSSFIASFDSSVNLDTADIEPNVLTCFLSPYLTSGSNIKDAQPEKECVQIDSLSGVTVSIDESGTVRRLRASDRYYLASPFDFSYNDSLVIVLDEDPSNKTFPVPLYRRAIANTTMSVDTNNFRAYDTESGATASFSQYFGSAYSFKNYKAMMRARNVIDPLTLVDEDAILYKSAVWGSAGNNYKVGYFYPTSASSIITHVISVDDSTKISIFLKSGAAVPNQIDGTTEWDVTVTPNTPVAGVDEVTYTWNSTGTNPAMTTLSPGHYVTINSNGEFSSANTGTFKISSATATSFTVRRPNGVAIAENNIATLTTNTIFLYQDSDTTAQDIVTYVTASLSDFISAELVDDNGTTGAGIIDTSTYEDNSFASLTEYIFLVDGINWISSSDLGASSPTPQFVFKKSLDLPSFDTNTVGAYAFNNGEEIRLIPTTAVQVSEFISVLAVSGLTTLADVSTSERNDKLQISSQILGSSGSVLVSGGTGNLAEAVVLSQSSKIVGTDLLKTTISRSAAAGFHGNQLVKLTSLNAQKRSIGISTTTNVTVDANTPVAGKSTVTLGNRDNQDLYFGQPRSAFRDLGRAFHVEHHGILTCISWDGATGSDPLFIKTVEINADGGNISVDFDPDTGLTSYIVTTGTRNFSEVEFGDSVTIQNMLVASNNGTFSIVGISDDKKTIVTDNGDGADAVAAAVAAPDFVISTEIIEGDIVEVDAPFTNLNRGKFRVIRRYANSIYINNPVSVEERVVITSNLRSLGFDGTTQFDITVPGDMRIEWNTAGTEPTLDNAKMGDYITVGIAFDIDNQGIFMVTSSGDNYIECANAKAVVESNISVASVGGDVLESHQPSMIFNPYENTRSEDKFVVSGSVLGVSSQGTYVVDEVLSKYSIIVTGSIDAQIATPLANNFTQVYVEEELPYEGYKKIQNIIADPSSINRYLLIFDSNEQFNKINDVGEVSIGSISKLNFSEIVRRGSDSYRYHTGLIAQSNRIVYGNPRDNITYPGVAAAGAEIFIKAPLVRRITISINIRINTGIPFTKVSEQVRNNIAALVNSSPIGESIAISDIISVVNSIPGVKAVSITSPSYSPTNDVIVVNPSEKPLILDTVNDVIVAKVGT